MGIIFGLLLLIFMGILIWFLSDFAFKYKNYTDIKFKYNRCIYQPTEKENRLKIYKEMNEKRFSMEKSISNISFFLFTLPVLIVGGLIFITILAIMV